MNVTKPALLPINHPIIERKQSFFKQSPHQVAAPLELPHFYSSDEKLKRKNAANQTEQRPLLSPDLIIREIKDNSKHTGYKYTKTEKNESPNKIGPTQLNKVNLIKEKLEEVMLRSHHHDTNKLKNHQKRIGYHEIIHIQRSEAQALKETNQTAMEINQNKVRYKIYKKNDADSKLLKGFPDGLESGISQPPKTIREIVRESKAQTEECPKNPLKEKSKPVLSTKPITESRVEGKHLVSRKEAKLRTLSTFQAAMARSNLNQEEKEHLKFIQDVLKKTIKNSSNLDHPESYIVCDKLKFERSYYDLMGPEHQKEFKTTLILTRLAYYLCAHYILDSTTTKPLINLFSKVLQAHQIIMTLLTDHDQRHNGEKFFSINKYSTKDLPTKHHFPSEKVVETTGNNLSRINNFIRRQLSTFFNAKDMIHKDLFMKFLNEEVEGNLDNIADMDKELKWKILKMPTSPFLPVPHPTHKYYLILDLDQTLIHFSPTKQTYQVRPYASEFLQNLSRYYELTVFTAATKDYADSIISSIDKGEYVSHRLYRNHLTFLMGESLKDISLLGRDLPVTLIVDNLQTNFRLHPDNGILIKSWYGDEKDAILPKLQNLLVRIALEFPDDLRKGVSLYANYISREITERTRNLKIKYDI